MNNELKIGDRVEYRGHKGTIKAGSASYKFHGSSRLDDVTGYLVMFDDDDDVFQFGNNSCITVNMVVLHEQSLVKIPVIAAIKAGEIYTNGIITVKLIENHNNEFVLTGNAGDLNLLYSDSPRSYDDMIEWLTSRNFKIKTA